MAVLFKRTIGNRHVLLVDSDPTVAPGQAAAIGSIAYLSNGNGQYYKVGSAATDWVYESSFLKSKVNTTTLANSVAETSLFSSAYTFPANYFVAGKSSRITLYGYRSKSGALATLQLKVKLGGTTILDTGAVTQPNITNEMFKLTGLITCRTTGAPGTFFSQGDVIVSSGALGNQYSPMRNTATASITTTGTLTLDVTAQWSVASLANTLSATNALIE